MICRSRKSRILALLLPLAALAAGFLGGIKASNKHVQVRAADGINVSDFVWDSNSGMHIYQEQDADPLYAFPNYGVLNGSSMSVYCSGCTEQGTVVQEGPYVFEYTDVTAMEKDETSQSDELWFKGICTLCNTEHEFSVPQLSGLNYSFMNASFSYFDPEGDSQATYEALPVSAKFFSIGGEDSTTYGLAEIDVYQTLAGDRNLMLTETIVLTNASGQETSLNGWSNRFGQTVYINNIQVKTYDDNCTEGWNYVANYGEFFYCDTNVDAVIATPTVVKSYYSESKVEIHYKMTAYYGNVVSPYSSVTPVNVITLENASASHGTTGVDISGRWSKTGSSTSSTSVSMTLENVGLREINDGMNYDPDEETFYWYNNPQASETYELRLDRNLSTLDVDMSDQSNTTARVVYTLYNITESQEGTFSSNQPLDFTGVVYNIANDSVTIIGNTSVSGTTLSDVIVHVPLSLITITGLPDPGWNYDSTNGLIYYDTEHPNATINLNEAIFDEDHGILYLDFYEYYDNDNITLPRETMINVQITGWTSDGFEVTGTFTTLNTQIDLIVQSYRWNFIGWNYSDGEFLYYEENKQFETEVTEVTFYEAETQDDSVFIFKLNVYETIWNQDTQSSSREFYLSDEIRLHNAVIVNEAQETGGENYITANWKDYNIEIYAYPTVTINKDIIENLPPEYEPGWNYDANKKELIYCNEEGVELPASQINVIWNNYGEDSMYSYVHIRYQVYDLENKPSFTDDIVLDPGMVTVDPRDPQETTGIAEGSYNGKTIELKIDRLDHVNEPVLGNIALFIGMDYDDIIYCEDGIPANVYFSKAIFASDNSSATLKGEYQFPDAEPVQLTFVIGEPVIVEEFGGGEGCIISGTFSEFDNTRGRVLVSTISHEEPTDLDVVPITEETIEQINNAMDNMDLTDDQKQTINEAIEEKKETLSDDAGTKIYQAISNTNTSLSDETTVKDAQKEVVVVVVETAIDVDSNKPQDVYNAKRIDKSLPSDADLVVEDEIKEFYDRQMYALIGGDDPNRSIIRLTRALSPKYKINVDVTDMTETEALAHLENEKAIYGVMTDFVECSVEHMGEAALRIRKCSNAQMKKTVKDYVTRVKVSSFREFDETKANNDFVEAVYKAIMLTMQQQTIDALEKDHKPSNNAEKEMVYKQQLEAVKDFDTFEALVIEVLRQKYVSLGGEPTYGRVQGEDDELDDFQVFEKRIFKVVFRSWALDDPTINPTGITLEQLTTATIETTKTNANKFTYRGEFTTQENVFLIVFASAIALGVAAAVATPIIVSKTKHSRRAK